MKIAVINSSFPAYNLAADKMLQEFKRQGHEVFFSPRVDLWSLQADKAYLSAIFTWNLPELCHDVNLLKERSIELEIGGPAATALPQYIEEKTGVIPHIGLDERFEHIDGKFKATFTSRGCPRDCPFCLVPKLEGRRIVEYDEFPIPVGKNPYVCDNNILATSKGHQELVVSKLLGVRNLDFNSGFDDRIFIKDPERYWRLFSHLKLECWRFAYDSPEQKEPIKACIDYLHSRGVDYRRIIVFCLVGYPGQTFEECRDRLQFLIDIECSPYPMRFRPLDSIEKNITPPGWRDGLLNLLFSYYGVPFIWRSCKFEDFRKSEKGERVMARLTGERVMDHWWTRS